MKIGEWDSLGRARAILQRHLGELGAAEYAAHVELNRENGRLRVLVATDVGLLDYHYQPAGSDPEGPWALRGQLYRWMSVKGLRLQTDGQLEDADETSEARWIWRLTAEEPKIELTAESQAEGERSPDALLPLARACIQHAG
ncbi:MAG: hypothetical protein M3P32_00745 [Chloroflexota bacterium]|nr:hypothetical protein [Chloroflexota bacterium]